VITPLVIFTQVGVFTAASPPSIRPPTLRRVVRGESIFEEKQPSEVVRNKALVIKRKPNEMNRCFGFERLPTTLAPNQDTLYAISDVGSLKHYSDISFSGFSIAL